MSSRQVVSEILRHLNDNDYWRQYVRMIESSYEDKVHALLMSDHPDEALRGECRALLNLLNSLRQNGSNQL